MLLLTSTSDILRVVTDAAGDIEPHASWVDNAAGTITPGRTNTASITTATTTTVVAAPASSVQRNVRLLSLRNNHASQTVVVTVEHTDGTNAETLIKVTLLAGELLLMDEFGRWTHYDANGGDYPESNIATRGQMEAATSTTTFVTPGLQHYHPGHPKAWCKNGVTGNILASYNISSVTDTGAGLCAPQINVDFTDAQWCCQVTVERTSTSLTVTNLKYTNIRFNLQVAGGVTLECYDGTATTAVQEDPATWHMTAYGTQV